MINLSEPFYIGPVKVRNRVFAAPLSGVSDLPFRRLTWAGGAGLVVNEMIASHELVNASKETSRRAQSQDCGPVMIQLAGRQAYWMGEAAKIAEAGRAQIIDINMGCPAKKVTGGASGSALMRDLDHAMTLIEAAVHAVSIPVTLKMRLGWDESAINAPELARRAVDAGVQMITVHGRTRCQFYDGVADWDAVAAVRHAINETGVINVPLVINGDIVDLQTARQALARSGADAVMVGRAAYGKPWAVGDIARGAVGEAKLTYDNTALLQYIISHYRAMLDIYGEPNGLRHARKHLGWYLDAHRSNVRTDMRSALMRCQNAEHVEALLAEIFATEQTTESASHAA